MKKKSKRPKKVIEFHECRRQVKVLQDRMAEINDEVIGYLENGDYPDCRLITVPRVAIDSDLAMAYCKKLFKNGTLTKEQFQALFYKLFDNNAFAALIEQKIISRKLMIKKKIVKESEAKSIRVSYK
jgi:hypothetical protein